MQQGLARYAYERQKPRLRSRVYHPRYVRTKANDFKIGLRARNASENAV
jgi:hypothetical protein